MRLLCGHRQVAKPPFQSPAEESWPALSWALKHHHKILVYAIFEEPTTEPTDGEVISEGIIELTSSPSARLEMCDKSTLGLILVHLFQLAANVLIAGPNFGGDPSIVDHANNVSISKVPWKLLYQSLQQLLDLGADTTIPHSRNENNLLQMLFATLGCISETTVDGLQLCDLLTRVLACNKTPLLLRSKWVPNALRGILEHDNTRIFAKVLQYLPKQDLGPEEDSLIGVAVAKGNIDAVRALIEAFPGHVQKSYINGQPAIELALEMQSREMVELLARHVHLNQSRISNTTLSERLLRIALERLSVEWVELLLQLGANPNLGYRALIEEPSPHTEFRYHLQIAAERSQTLKFLTLVRYGADPFLPAYPTIRSIILRRDNRVLMARLEEMEFLQPTKRSKALEVGLPKRWPPPSALLEACKMLALGVDEDETLRHFGVVQSHDAGIQASAQELKLIILDLVKTTRPDQLGLQCQEGNTALHYLTGGMDKFHHEALAVASHILAFGTAPWFLQKINQYGQTPMHRAIENGSKNRWRPPYIDSVSFIASYFTRGRYSLRSILGGDDSILGFAISKGAPIHPVIKLLLDAGSDPNGTLHGATPLEIAVNRPAFSYASEVTLWLLSHGADPSVNPSGRGSLLDVVTAERRHWLQASLRWVKLTFGT